MLYATIWTSTRKVPHAIVAGKAWGCTTILCLGISINTCEGVLRRMFPLSFTVRNTGKHRRRTRVGNVTTERVVQGEALGHLGCSHVGRSLCPVYLPE